MCFYINSVRTSLLILNVTKVRVFCFKLPLAKCFQNHLTSFAFCLTTISISEHLLIVMIHEPSLEVSKGSIKVLYFVFILRLVLMVAFWGYFVFTDNHSHFYCWDSKRTTVLFQSQKNQPKNVNNLFYLLDLPFSQCCDSFKAQHSIIISQQTCF